LKKVAVGLLSFVLFLGLGSVVFAAQNSNSDNGRSFEKMLPFIQKMHPDSSKKELQDMYKSCQENNGMMNGTKGELESKNMMN